jgi:hypothetical protein
MALWARRWAVPPWAMRLTEDGQEDAAEALVQRALGVVLGRR